MAIDSQRFVRKHGGGRDRDTWLPPESAHHAGRSRWTPSLCFLWVLILLCAAGHARVRHVSKDTLSAVDSGSQERTIGAALANARAGDRIVIHGGVYREELTVERSGLADAPISMEAAEGEYVVLTGADHLTNWTKLENDERVYRTHWPHKFVGWNEHYTHPGDDYHRLIGRCEQVFVGGYPLGQVLERDKLGRGTFYVDMDAQRLYVRPANDQDITGSKTMVEASVRSRILRVKGNHIAIKGLRFRYAANRAQQGAVEFSGDHLTVEDCLFEYTNSSGAEFTGENTTVRNNVFAYNRDAQVWGWFDVDDERHWPRSMQEKRGPALTGQRGNGGASPTLLELEDLKLTLENNLYWPGPGHGLFHWGVPWKNHRKYDNLDQVRSELSLARGSKVEQLHMENYPGLDFHVPADSPAVKMDYYPRGSVPGVSLGRTR